MALQPSFVSTSPHFTHTSVTQTGGNAAYSSPPVPPTVIRAPAFTGSLVSISKIPPPAPPPAPNNVPMRLPAEQMNVYGLEPSTDAQVLVVCKNCSKPVLIVSFRDHLAKCVVDKKPPVVAPSFTMVAPVQMPSPAPPAPLRAAPSPTPPPPTPQPLSSTRTGSAEARKPSRAPPTPPKLVKIKKNASSGSSAASRISFGGKTPPPPMMISSKKSPRSAIPPPDLGDEDEDEEDEDEDEEEERMRRQEQQPRRGRGRPRRKEISVLEISKGNGEEGKVTIMVEGGPAVSPTSLTSSRAKIGGMPLASRRWTRRNQLTGLSLSFKIRSDDEDDDDDEELFSISVPQPPAMLHARGGDLAEGWAYVAGGSPVMEHQRVNSGKRKSDVELDDRSEKRYK